MPGEIGTKEDHMDEGSQQVLLKSNCKCYLDDLVPSSSRVKPTAKDPQIIMTVDDRFLKLLTFSKLETHKVVVKLETLKELSQNWLILPIFGLDFGHRSPKCPYDYRIRKN